VDAIVTSKLTRTIVDSVSDIDLTAEDAGDYIYMVKAADGSEGNIYTEYMVVNGSLELIGSTATDLQGYVTSSLYESEVGDLSKLGKENTTIVDEILSIEERLTWQPIEEDN
jgi:hypothetical protein